MKYERNLILGRWCAKNHRRSATALVALLVLLLSLPLRVAAQGCPTLDTGDFTATLIAANSDCHTPARLSVVYRNAVAVFTAITYSVSKDRMTWGTPVVAPRPGSEAVLPLDGWNEGDPIYIRATATCGTQQPRVVLPKIVYHVKTSADVLATPVVTPAGGCEATSGAVSVSLTGVSGFSRVQYKLERDPVRAGQQAVPVGNLTARSPYQQTLFFNLAPGRYTLHVRATPNCTPTAPGAAWKDGAYEWEQPVDVEHFSVIPTPILTRGTCPGGVTIDVAKVVGIGGLRYEIWKKGQRATGAPALQTATVAYPAFSHTFTGLPLGDYEVQATSTDCEARATSSFSVTAGALVQPQVTIVRHTYAGCAAGKIEVSLPGTTAACPVSYTLTPAAGGTPQVRSNVTTERTQFTGLAAGTYTLTTSYGGQTQTTPVEIKIVTPGTLKVEPSPADVYCSPTGRMKVTLEGGTLDEPATLTLSLNGTAVRSVSLNAGETTKHIDGLLPGAYSLALRTECGATAEAETAIAAKNVPRACPISACRSTLKTSTSALPNPCGTCVPTSKATESRRPTFTMRWTAPPMRCIRKTGSWWPMAPSPPINWPNGRLKTVSSLSTSKCPPPTAPSRASCALRAAIPFSSGATVSSCRSKTNREANAPNWKRRAHDSNATSRT